MEACLCFRLLLDVLRRFDIDGCDSSTQGEQGENWRERWLPRCGCFCRGRQTKREPPAIDSLKDAAACTECGTWSNIASKELSFFHGGDGMQKKAGGAEAPNAPVAMSSAAHVIKAVEDTKRLLRLLP